MATTRRATAEDLPFMVHILCLAAGGRSGPCSVQECHDDPVLAHYLDRWTPAQTGLLCYEKGHPIGACWTTMRPPEDPGRGFVAPGIAELIIGIAPDHQGMGHGSFLLASTLQAADRAAVPSLSVAVDQEDPRAVALFSGAGFTTVDTQAGRAVMLRVP